LVVHAQGLSANIATYRPTDTPWTPGNFEIHLFAIGQGHSQLIIFPSGFSILIDLCELGPTSSTTAKKVGAKIQTILGSLKVNVVVITHQVTFWELLNFSIWIIWE
jgi:hypothetical protein